MYSVYAGRLSAVGTDTDDPLESYWKLRKNLMLYDIPERPIEISGRDAVQLLEKTFTRRISNLPVLRACYGIICAPHGGLVMDGVLIRLAEDRFLQPIQRHGQVAGYAQCQCAPPCAGRELPPRGPGARAAHAGSNLRRGWGRARLPLHHISRVGRHLLINRHCM